MYDRPMKTDDTVVQLKDNTIVQIVKFICNEQRYYMTIRKLVVSLIEENLPMSHFMKVIEKQNDTMVTSIDNIKRKLIFIDVGECYVCALPNTIEIQ